MQKNNPADTGTVSKPHIASPISTPLIPVTPKGIHEGDLIRVRFEGRVFEFAQIETGALQKEGIEKHRTWYGYSRFALFNRPADNAQLRRLLEILTRNGWGGRIVSDGGVVTFPEWNVRFQINPDEMTYNRAVYAIVQVSYKAARREYTGKVDSSGDVWEVSGGV